MVLLEGVTLLADMADTEKIRQAAIAEGGQDWEILADAVNDSEFQSILDTQEKFAVNGLISNPSGIRSYRERCTSIIAKYIAWKIYKDSDLRGLKKKIAELSNQVGTSQDELATIRDTAKYIGGATVLVKYSDAFSTRAGKHGLNAVKQLKWYMFSLLGFGVVVWFTFFFSIAEFAPLKSLIAEDLKGIPLNAGFFAMKAFLLVFAYQITQFFKKNYGAEKHLQEVYQHRGDVLQSLHAVYSALSNTGEKDKILSAGVLFAYERGETGYITTKEGAGSGDGLIEGIVSRVFR